MIAEIQPHRPHSTRNHHSFRQLMRSIVYSQGQFSLILACCNQSTLRQKIRQKLHQECSTPLREIFLDKSATTLYTSIKQELGEEQPDALIVYGLESVEQLNQLLMATDAVRDEFRKFSCPLVLWVTDEIIKQLIRVAPHSFSWASTGIKFEEA